MEEKISSYDLNFLEKLQGQISANPLTPNELEKILNSPEPRTGIFGIYSLDKHERGGEGYLWSRTHQEEEIRYITINECFEDKFLHIMLHEILHFMNPCVIGSKEDYWKIDNTIESEVKKILNNYGEEFQSIYRKLKTNQIFPRIEKLESDRNITKEMLIKNLIINQEEFKNRKIIFKDDRRYIDDWDDDESFFTRDF